MPKTSRPWLASEAKQAGVSLLWLQTSEGRFFRDVSHIISYKILSILKILECKRNHYHYKTVPQAHDSGSLLFIKRGFICSLSNQGCSVSTIFLCGWLFFNPVGGCLL